jgi:hypothetical protein
MDIKQSIKYIKALSRHALSNKIEYLKVDGIELKFSPLAFVDQIGFSGSSDRTVKKATNTGGRSTVDLSVPTETDPDLEPFDTSDEDLLFYSAK